MSDDELVVTLGATVVALVGWGRFFLQAMVLTRLGPRPHPGRMAWLVPVVVGATVFAVLRTIAASDVRDAPPYLFQYSVMGMAWVVLASWAFGFLGVSWRDDVLERGNGAALPAALGLYAGVGLAFAGANVGEGPGWWVVVASALVSTLGFLAAAALVSSLGGVHEAVTVDRDLGAGVHAGGVFGALGVVAGRGAAGNWEGLEPMLADFVWHAWPLAPFAVAGVAVARTLRSMPRPTRISAGFVSATLHLVVALGYVALALPPP